MLARRTAVHGEDLDVDVDLASRIQARHDDGLKRRLDRLGELLDASDADRLARGGGAAGSSALDSGC